MDYFLKDLQENYKEYTIEDVIRIRDIAIYQLLLSDNTLSVIPSEYVAQTIELIRLISDDVLEGKTNVAHYFSHLHSILTETLENKGESL